MLILSEPYNLLLARCDTDGEGKHTLRLHIRLDGCSEAAQFTIEIPETAVDGESSDHFSEFADAAAAAYRRSTKTLEFLRIGEENPEVDAALAEIDSGFQKLQALAKKSA